VIRPECGASGARRPRSAWRRVDCARRDRRSHAIRVRLTSRRGKRQSRRVVHESLAPFRRICGSPKGRKKRWLLSPSATASRPGFECTQERPRLRLGGRGSAPLFARLAAPVAAVTASRTSLGLPPHSRTGRVRAMAATPFPAPADRLVAGELLPTSRPLRYAKEPSRLECRFARLGVAHGRA
jgi:hypothetical protein